MGVKGGRSCTASPSARKFWRGAAPPRYDPAALPRPMATQPSSAQPALLITIALIALGGLRLRWIVATAELARQCVASLSSRWLAGWASDSLLQYSTSSTTGSPLTEHMPRPSVEYGCGRSTAGPQCQEQRLGARRAKLQGGKRPEYPLHLISPAILCCSFSTAHQHSASSSPTLLPTAASLPMDCSQQGFVVAGDSASLQSIPVPTPKEGEAVVRVLIAGVCNTDLEIMKGHAAASRLQPPASASTTSSTSSTSSTSYLISLLLLLHLSTSSTTSSS